MVKEAVLIDPDEEKVERILRHLLARRGKEAGRTECPDEEVLAGYLDGNGAEERRRDIEAHLADCAVCLEQAIVAYEAEGRSGAEEAHRELVERVMALVPASHGESPFLELVVRLVKNSLELISTSGKLVPITAPVGIRGRAKPLDSTLLQVEKEMGRLKVGVEVEAVEAGLCEVIVRVGAKDGRVVDGIRLTLFSRGREQASYLARQGEAVFDRIPRGEYNLAISDSGASVGRIRLRIME